MGGEDDDLGAGRLLDDLLGRSDAVDRGHFDVHDHDLGLLGLGQVDRFKAVGGLTDDFDVVVLEQAQLDCVTHDVVVVSDQNRGHVSPIIAGAPYFCSTLRRL